METMATELLKELKASAKRWFVAFVIMIVLEITTIGVFMYYIHSTAVDEYEITQEIMDSEIDSSTVTQKVDD